ncbi:hypothetical protein [Vibrio aestuarianus]|uniref:hypothetical protein n=1 Tax=Vibrio aestuarianus TaxID=28171 RepID=UPI00237D2E4C|nr:hypothetical protein [Vibrio aestuarianus]MDE1211746.1 hypothetical protein [Vibrio aestuarianus]
MLVPSMIRSERDRERTDCERNRTSRTTYSSSEYYELLSSSSYKPTYSGRVVRVKVEVIEVKSV